MLTGRWSPHWWACCGQPNRGALSRAGFRADYDSIFL